MSAISISKTKIIPPRRRPELLTRRRLLDRLFDYLDKRLILLSAPAGYGKTSLLIDLVNQTELPCCWLTLDQLDRDPQRFIAYLIAALAERYPDFGGQSQALLREMKSFEQDIERLAVSLANEMYTQIHEHFILVVDDFHLVEDVLPIQRFINRFLQLVDENCHLVLSSRILSSLPELTVMVAREQVAGLSFSDLAFRFDEIQALLEQNNNVRISDEEARKLFEETEGWITGLQFSGSDVFRKNRGLVQLNPGFHLFDYLGQQVLDRQPRPVQDFLMRTSLMEEFDAPLCKTVLSPYYAETQDWHGWIKKITQNNLFALPVGSDGSWLRYHHLFRDFLQDRFRREYPQEVESLLARLGKAYEDLGEWDKAHHVYKQLNDMTALVELVEHASLTMLLNAHLTLATWLNDLPPSLLQTRPGLISIRGVLASMNDDLSEGLGLLNQAEQAFRSNHDRFGLALTLTRRASVNRQFGDYQASLRDAEEVIRLARTEDSLQMLYAEALRVKGVAHYRMGQVRQATQLLETSLTQYIRLKDQSNIPLLFMETGLIYSVTGKNKEAEAAYGKALEIWRKEKNLFLQANVLNNLGVFWHAQGNYEKAAMTYEEGFLYAQQSRNLRMEALISIGLGDLYAELEDFTLAAQNYKHAEILVSDSEDRFLLHFLMLAEVNLALVQNNLTQAHSLIEDIAPSIESSKSGYETALLDLARGRLFLQESDPARAVQTISEAELYFDEDGRAQEMVASRIWLAAALYKAGDVESARRNLKAVLENKSVLPHVALLTARQTRRWLEGMQNDAGIGRTMRELFQRVDRMADSLPEIRRQMRLMARVGSVPAPPLTIQALGKSTVSVGGKTLTIADWQTKSVRDLFFYFLMHAKPLTKEQVANVLWPELLEPTRIKLRFKNEVYRLRRAIGQEVITFNDEQYSFNRALDFEYDAEAFAAYISKARSSLTAEEQIEYYQKAVDLVRGPFLEDIDADWAQLEREHINQSYLAALLKLAELCLQAAQFERGLLACERALEQDATLEPAYALCMQIYHRMGDRAAVVKTYQAAKENLQGSLDISLSEQIEETYRHLVP